MAQPHFGDRLREQRQRLGLSQADLAGPGLSMSYLSLLESGKRRPTVKVAQALATRLGVAVEYLLTGHPSGTRQQRDLDIRFAELSLANGDAPAAWEILKDLLQASSPEDPDWWRLRHVAARCHERTGNLESAVGMLEELRDHADRHPNDSPWMEVAIDLSRCYRELGDVARAVHVAEQAVAQAKAGGLEAETEYPRLVVTLAGASRERGDHAHASQLLRRLLDGLPGDAPRSDRGAALWNAALVQAERGFFGEGIALAERALAHFAEQEEVRAEGLLRTTLAWMLLESPDGDVDRARALLMDARQRLLSASMKIEVAYTETELSRAASAEGNAEEAIAWARSALRGLGDDDRLEAARAKLALARGLLLNDEAAAAIEEMTQAAEALTRRDAGRQAAGVWRDLAELHQSIGDGMSAAEAFASALDALGVPGRRTARPPVSAEGFVRASPGLSVSA